MINEQILDELSELLSPENQDEAIAVARALCPFAEAATDFQVFLCVAMVEAKGDLDVVSAVSGYHKSKLRGHLQAHICGRIIKHLAKEKLRGEGYLTGMYALMDVASSKSATANARTNAAKVLMEMAGQEDDRQPGGRGEKDLNNMTLRELESYVNSIKQDLVRLPPPVDVEQSD